MKLLDNDHDTYCRLQTNKYGVSFRLLNISSYCSGEAAAWLYTRFENSHRLAISDVLEYSGVVSAWRTTLLAQILAPKSTSLAF
jgi:hypothetical protein